MIFRFWEFQLIAGDYAFMAADLSSMRKRESRGIIAHLSWATSEWFLIFLLFLEALFSYFLREFAKYCELQMPCPLCPRLDHLLGKMEVGCSWSLLCSSHKEEISSLVLSSLRRKFSDARRNCGERLEPVGYNANVEPLRSLRCFSHQDSIKKTRSKRRTAIIRHPMAVGSSFGYTKLNGSSSPIDVGLGRRDQAKMLMNDLFSDEQTHQDCEIKDQSGVIDLDELKKVDCSPSDAMDEHASRKPSSLSLSLSSAVSELPHSTHSVPSASTTLRITKKSIYIEESAAMNVEATAESSSDESTYSLFQCAQSMKLIREDRKSMSRVSKSESGLLLKDEDKEEDCIKSLYEELEEERKAAGVAASQAMAMITRLQEEKAAVEMEAVQYIQMMELRAEHDMESLEEAKMLLSEKEKELEFFRNNFHDLQEESLLPENDAASRSINSPGTSESASFLKENSSVTILGLEKLVKNLYKDYCSENVKNSPNGIDLYEIKDGVESIEDTVMSFDESGSYALKGNTAQHNSAAFLKGISTVDGRFGRTRDD